MQIIGADAPDQVQRLHGQNGIEVVGWVPKLEPYFQAARLSVAPLLYGAGVKGKVISAFCEGLPVVGTHLALEGLPQAACDAALIADEADAFAKHIIDVIDDDRLWLEKSRAGMDYVAADLSRARGVARIAEMEARIGLTRPLS